MALAMKCDICGRYYHPYNYITPHYPNTLALTTRDDKGNNMLTGKIYDLCPDCLLAIAMCIEDLKRDKDDKVGIEMLRKSFNLPVTEGGNDEND